MKKISLIKEKIRSSFWIVPSLTTIGLIGLVPLLGVVKSSHWSWPKRLFLSEDISLEGARLILSSIATASMTVVGVLFSITIVVLQQVSAQYSPRVIENFIRSYAGQVVLGVYIGTFGQSLLLLRNLQASSTESGGANYKPEVNLAILMALICLGLLIYYIRHLVKSIKSNHILASISKECIKSLEDIYSEMNHGSKNKDQNEFNKFTYVADILNKKSGYLEEIKWNAFARAIGSKGWQIEVLVEVGDYLYEKQCLAKVRSNNQIENKILKKLLNKFVIDLVRTHTQDPRFGIKQMADMALKALSPGINDPSTAIEALNGIGDVLVYFTQYCCHEGDVHISPNSSIKLKLPSYESFVSDCFDQIILSGTSYYLVLKKVDDILIHCLEVCNQSERRKILKFERAKLKAYLLPLEKKFLA